MDERRFVDAHGVEVFSRWWPTDDPRGVVLVAHGASEHSGRYDRFARALNGAGFAAVALDHRGHGRTAAGADRALMGAGGGDALLDDVHGLRAAAQAELGTVPTFLFGHSMGSLISLAYLTRHSAGLAGGILCGFPVDPAGATAMAELLQPMADAGMRDEPATGLLSSNNAPFEPARTPFDWLSRDPDEVDRYLADELCGDNHPLTYGYLIDLLGVVGPAAGAIASIQCPVLVIAGDQDPAAGMGAHPTALTDALRAAGVKADLTLYPGARHEILNETNRDEVTADVVEWLQTHV